ncbi:MAG TPA: DUF6519 domain-containing protein [Dokdonella sp.]
MKGDFSRIRFDTANRYSRVLLQQGRVTLDADANEQTDILLHYLRTLARDLIGDYGGPLAHGGFALSVSDGKLAIGAGRYYVHGILCESDGCDYAAQPDYTPAPAAAGSSGDPLLAFLKVKTPGDDRFWVYLDVWERHLSAIEVPALREVALGGPDTCTRSKVVWQVKARALSEIVTALQARATALQKQISAVTAAGGDATALQARLQRVQDALAQLQQSPDTACAAPLEALDGGEGGLGARLEKGVQPKTPCIVAPDARYRGAENQLYRVEIHQGGSAGDATFKWSRDNGSVASAWLGGAGNQVNVADARGFCAGMWVELSDDARDLAGVPGVLVRISQVEDDTLTLDAASAAAAATIVRTAALHPKVRAWDETGDGLANGMPLLVANAAAWLDLEDGIQVRFDADGEYRSGDYWLIPARVAAGPDGGIDWPDGLVLPPRRAAHHYAPLGFVEWQAQANGQRTLGATPCTCTLRPLTPCQAVRARALVDAQANIVPAPAKTVAAGKAKTPRKPKPA